jgi:catechol-2,3-dioxygenase
VELAAAGVRPERAVDHGVTASLYYLDPDGNEVELYASLAHPKPIALDERTPWDPRSLADARAAGADEAGLFGLLRGA